MCQKKYLKIRRRRKKDKKIQTQAIDFFAW